MPSHGGRKECPNCGLSLPAASKVCEFCGWDFEDDWASEMEELEKELLSKTASQKEPPIDKAIDSSIRDSEAGKPKAPRDVEPADAEKAGPTIECPTCGGLLKEGVEYCPHCGADLKAEGDWASEIAELEKELMTKGRKVDKASLDSMIQATMRSPVTGQPEDMGELAEKPLKPAEAEESGQKCPACGAPVKSAEESCEICGAELEGDEWANEIDALEKEFLAKREAIQEAAEEEEELEPSPEEPEEAIPEPTPPTPVPEEPEPLEAEESSPEPKSKFEKLKKETPLEVEELPAPPSEKRPIPAPQELPKPPKPARTEVTAPSTYREIRGRVNGLKQGRINGTKRGMVNGTKQGMINGTKRGKVNGTRQGMVNGTKRGMVNGTKQGKVNGIALGKVNGLKFPVKAGDEKAPRFFSRSGPLFSGRRYMVVILIVAILIMSSAFAYFTMQSAPQGIIIDGSFSDWASVPAYSFSTVMPGELGGVNEGKLQYSQHSASVSKLFFYANLQSQMFASEEVSTVYVMLDIDADPSTGYSTGEAFGADRMAALSGWNGSIRQATEYLYNSTTDQNDWNSWLTQSSFPHRMSGTELEISLNVENIEPLIQIMTTMADSTTSGPVMSPSGTILARQEPLIDGTLATTTSLSVLRVSVVALGVPSGTYTVQTAIVNDSGQATAMQDVVVTTTGWTSVDFTADLSDLSSGDGFRYSFSASSGEFSGAIDVTGPPSTGYLMQYPTSIVVDGVFADWESIKITDTDSAQIENPRIDIQEYGVASQNGNYFMYTGTAGALFDGADVPEQRNKPTSGQGGSSVVRLRKTGEDLLQAFIDKDPLANVGKVIHAEGSVIRADLLVEIFGRDGEVTSTSVKSWSASDNDWIEIGSVGKTGVGLAGVEFSVAKSLLGNISTSDIFFFTTDWKARSDNATASASIADPWAVRGTSTSAGTYWSNDGAAWTNAGSISLLTGEQVVAMAHSLDRTFVFAVTNTGRVYDWEINEDTAWGPEVTGPCNSTSIVGIAPNSATGEGGCLIMASNGWTWTNDALGVTRGWTNQSKVVDSGFDDFKDVCYNATGGRYWAIRSSADTPAYYSSTLATPWTATSEGSGSTSPQVHVYHVGSSDISTEAVYVLCEDGSIRYAADPTDPTPWVSRGDLPAPGTEELPSYSRYVAMDRDENGVFWAITNTSFTYDSSDKGATWTYTGNISVNDIVSLACPTAYIPEFESLILPVFFAAALIFTMKVKRSRRTENGNEIEESE